MNLHSNLWWNEELLRFIPSFACPALNPAIPPRAISKTSTPSQLLLNPLATLHLQNSPISKFPLNSTQLKSPINKTTIIMSAFETAVADSKKLTSKPSNDDLLQLYGLYKVASGEDITKSEQPGTFDLKGKAKKRAWQKIVDEGITSDQAKEKLWALRG
ncbi:uncharacterized protein L3040_002065 [Drepanopeziza brunnea f. sp. 'multigermtubi']|uniref:uncharacterized protein n=1 Tax=Drepanopeziza brunnea f. sp. 'multigermtubi' TaxID=698441 RepID=UPI0023A1471F|nr:hypothetical protein L3040_002065 [Drepanopeziza brunnea f. sp. 'multigermtubi']